MRILSENFKYQLSQMSGSEVLSDIGKKTGPKKYNTNKESPFTAFNIDDKKFVSSPQWLKMLANMNNIYTITPISVSNISQEGYTGNKDFITSSIMDGNYSVDTTQSMNTMFNINLVDSVNYQIGLHFTFKGTMRDIFVLYYFNYNWLSNDDGKNEFTEWLKEKVSSDDSVVIISGEMKGWGRNKLVKAFESLYAKLDNLQDISTLFKQDNTIILSVNDIPSNISRKTVNIVKKATPKVENKKGSDIDELIANVLQNQANMKQLMETQATIITELLKRKNAAVES